MFDNNWLFIFLIYSFTVFLVLFFIHNFICSVVLPDSGTQLLILVFLKAFWEFKTCADLFFFKLFCHWCRLYQWQKLNFWANFACMEVGWLRAMGNWSNYAGEFIHFNFEDIEERKRKKMYLPLALAKQNSQNQITQNLRKGTNFREKSYFSENGKNYFV